jgi:hypothetical protein
MFELVAAMVVEVVEVVVTVWLVAMVVVVAGIKVVVVMVLTGMEVVLLRAVTATEPWHMLAVSLHRGTLWPFRLFRPCRAFLHSFPRFRARRPWSHAVSAFITDNCLSDRPRRFDLHVAPGAFVLRPGVPGGIVPRPGLVVLCHSSSPKGPQPKGPQLPLPGALV